MRLPLCCLLALAACSSDDSGMDPAPPETESFYFCSDRTGNYELFLLEDGQELQLTDDSAYDSWWPRLSPQGDRMLFYRTTIADRPATGGWDNNYDDASLWGMDYPDGMPEELIAKDANGWLTQGVADWSPDGTALVMAAQSSLDGNRWHLFVTEPDGTNPTRITTRTSLYLDPSWSPDGTRIVCAAFPPDYTGTDLAFLEIYTMAADGTDELRLTDDDLRDHDPYWSPDGARIAFETAVDPDLFDVGRWALRTVAPDGTGLETVIDDGNINTLPRWSPDSTELYFHRLVFGGPGKFFTARIGADGSGYEVLTSGGDYDDVDIDLVPTLSKSAASAPRDVWILLDGRPVGRGQIR